MQDLDLHSFGMVNPNKGNFTQRQKKVNKTKSIFVTKIQKNYLYNNTGCR